MIGIKRLVFSLSLVLMSLSAFAFELSNSYGLFVQPESCVLGKREILCEQRVRVSWKTPNQQAVCLYIKDREDPLDCWKNLTENVSVFTIKTEGKLVFELRKQQSGGTIYTANYKIYKQVARYRKKRRNPWSFY